MVTLEDRIEALEIRVETMEQAFLSFADSMTEAYSGDIPFFYQALKTTTDSVTELAMELIQIKHKLGMKRGKGATIH